MGQLTKQDWAALLGTRGVCVSIYLPTHPRGAESAQDSIRLKNLLETAERQMLSSGVSSAETKLVLEPARQLMRELPYGRFTEEGFAIFASRESFRTYRLPIRFREMAVVGPRFEIRPLLPLLSGDGEFYLLAISDNRVRLFQGDRSAMTELECEFMPASLREALASEDFDRQPQLHTSGASGKRIAIHHGHSAAIEDGKQGKLRYFRQIDEGLRSIAHQNRIPLVLAGVEDAFPIYREANTHPVLLERGIPGNPDRATAGELHAAAWKIVEPYFAKEKVTALNKYRDLTGTPRTSSDLGETLCAAGEGRVDRLFIKSEVDLFGAFDQDRKQVSIHLKPEPGDEELLNLAAVQAIQHGAMVYPAPAEEMPEGRDIAAVFRY